MRPLLFLVLSAVAVGQQLDFKVEVDSSTGKYSFYFSGTTDLPDGSIVSASVYMLDQEGQKADLNPEDKFRTAKVTGGKFTLVLYRFQKKLFSGRYVGAVTVDSRKQERVVRNSIKQKFPKFQDMEKGFEFQFGNPADFEKEVDTEKETIRKDFETLGALFKELRETLGKKPDRNSWFEWKKGWLVRLDLIDSTNNLRFDTWAVEVERLGKQAVYELVAALDDAACICDDVIDGNSSPDEVEKHLDAFKETWSTFSYRLDLVKLPPEDLKKILAMLEAVRDEVKQILEKTDAAQWKQKRAGYESDVLAAVMKLASSSSKNYYYIVLELSKQFSSLLAACDEELAKEPAKIDRAKLAQDFAAFESKLKELAEAK